MPALLLTLLLLVLWIAFAALGYLHGGWRQVVVLAAMLLSYAVLSEWAVPNGRDLATQFHWRIARTTTAVGLLYLFGGTAVLGFLGSFALDRPRPLGARERQCGALMGALNGGLLLALLLRTLRSYSFATGGGRVLRETALSRFLIEGIGYLLLAALVIGAFAAAVGAWSARLVQPDVLSAADVAATPVIAPPLPRPEIVPAPEPSPVAPALPPVPEPVYQAEPIIDWPATPPPGAPIERAEAAPVVVGAPEPVTAPAATASPPPPLATAPTLPRRVDPPMRFPVAEMIAAASAPPAARTAPPAAAVPPPAIPAHSPAVPARGARPTAPPPGALQPAFIPPTVPQPLPPPAGEPAPPPSDSRPFIPSAEDVPPVVRELDVPTEDSPPVVRELDAVTRDAPPSALPASEAATPESPPTLRPAAEHRDARRPEGVPPATEGDMTDRTSAPATVEHAPKAVSETAPLSVVVPPPLPPVASRSRPLTAADRAAASPAPPEDSAKGRAGFARVAVARQPGQRAEQPPGQPSPSESDPFRPPLPTGPRVHACPTCGYPVRDHARYCPNCGSRQRP